jgi:hypothetical protein
MKLRPWEIGVPRAGTVRVGDQMFGVQASERAARKRKPSQYPVLIPKQSMWPGELLSATLYSSKRVVSDC